MNWEERYRALEARRTDRSLAPLEPVQTVADRTAGVTLHRDAFFTVWRPELVALRVAAGLPRHPAQVIMSAHASIAPLAARPRVTAVAGTSLHEQFAALRAHGIGRACSIGGRRSATALVDAGLVQDVCVTTTSATGGAAGTPWWTGERTLPLRAVLVKRWNGEHGPVHFELLVLTD